MVLLWQAKDKNLMNSLWFRKRNIVGKLGPLGNILAELIVGGGQPHSHKTLLFVTFSLRCSLNAVVLVVWLVLNL